MMRRDIAVLQRECDAFNARHAVGHPFVAGRQLDLFGIVA
jgi:hypothetical protein